MSFATDLNYIMHNDSSLNSYCTGGIHYENLPENFELVRDWIVYSFNKYLQENCLDQKEAFTRYSIQLKIVANDTIQLETINDHTVDYLNNTIYGGIQDLMFTGDNHTVDLEKNIYMNTLQFDAIYV